jgi:predicted negative regulator of RcsB-dependent stress response
MKRDMKKKLKEDEFAHGFSWVLDFLEEWKKEFIIGGVVIAAVVLLFVGVHLIKGIGASKDSAVLGEILALRADLGKNPQSLVRLEALAGKGKFSRIASSELAAYWVGQGNLDKAEQALAGVKRGSGDFFDYQAQDLAAQIALLKGDADRAIKILLAIEEAKPKDYALDAVLFHRAQALEKKGDKAEALKLFQKIQADYPQSYYGYDAGLRAKKLEAPK